MLLSSFASAAAAPSEAHGSTETIRLVEGWRYRWGDGARRPDGVPERATEPGAGAEWPATAAFRVPPGRGDERILWLSLEIPEGGWHGPALLLDGVANVFEVYAGGRRIYSNGELRPGGVETYAHSSWHLLPLPPEVIGGRILLRVQSSGPFIGVGADARVGAHAALLTWAERRQMVPYLLGGLLMVAATLAACGFAFRRDRRELGHLAVFAGGIGAMFVVQSGIPEVLWRPGRAAYLAHIVGLYFAVPGLTAFVGATVVSRTRWFGRWVQLQYGLAAVLAFALLFVPASFPWVFPVFRVLAVIAVGVCLAVALREAVRGSTEAKIMLAGVSVLLVVALVRVLVSIRVLGPSWDLLHFGVLGLVGSLVGIVFFRAGQLVRTLEGHAEALRQRQSVVESLAAGMRQGATELVTVVQQLRTSTGVQNEGVNQQAAAIEQAQVTVEEIRQTSAITAERASELARSAVHADVLGQQGMAALERTLDGLEAIRHEVAEMTRRIVSLEARTREIAGVVGTVKGLADQSNMLALNAAIEAARSGEHGRGFGVVAREVRNLADQSVEATKRIGEILESLNNSMQEAADRSARGEQKVGAALEEVRASGEQLRKLATIVGETGQSVRQITHAVSQQDSGTRQIADAISDLSSHIRRTLEAVAQTEAVTGSVQRLAAGMAGLAREPTTPRDSAT